MELAAAETQNQSDMEQDDNDADYYREEVGAEPDHGIYFYTLFICLVKVYTFTSNQSTLTYTDTQHLFYISFVSLHIQDLYSTIFYI